MSVVNVYVCGKHERRWYSCASEVNVHIGGKCVRFHSSLTYLRENVFLKTSMRSTCISKVYIFHQMKHIQCSYKHQSAAGRLHIMSKISF